MTTMLDEKQGYVYVISRPDLMKCYVGQSVRAMRPAMHLEPGNYRYDELCADGGTPTVDIVCKGTPQGERLDSREREAMRTAVTAGWTLVNRMGPDAVWPNVPFASASAGGKKGSAVRTKAWHDACNTDPDLAARRSTYASAGNKAMRARRATDPEFDARMKEAERRGSLKAAGVRAHKRENDLEWAAKERTNARKGGLAGGYAGGKATAALRYQCNECNKVSTPGGLGFHQKTSGHVGRTVLNTLVNKE